MRKETTEEGFTFPYVRCWKGDCLTTETAKLTDIVKGLELRKTNETVEIESDDRERDRTAQCSDKKDEEKRLRGGRVTAREHIGERTTENMTCRKVTGEKMTVEKEGGTMGQERR